MVCPSAGTRMEQAAARAVSKVRPCNIQGLVHLILWCLILAEVSLQTAQGSSIAKYDLCLHAA